MFASNDSINYISCLLKSLYLLREDEIKKHAPGLVVRTFHSSRKKKINNIDLSSGHVGPTNRRIDEEGSPSANVCDADAMVALSKADVLISSSTFYWPKLGEQWILLNTLLLYIY